MTDAVTTNDAPGGDLRRARGARTSATIVESCRRLMLGGTFQPAMKDVAEVANCSVRSVFQHFESAEKLYRAALNVPTRDAIAKLIMPADRLPPPLDADCIAFAAVFGRPIPPKGEQPAPAVAAE